MVNLSEATTDAPSEATTDAPSEATADAPSEAGSYVDLVGADLGRVMDFGRFASFWSVRTWAFVKLGRSLGRAYHLPPTPLFHF